MITYSHLTTDQGLMSMYIMYLWRVKGKWLYIRDSSPMNIGSSALVRSLGLTRPVLLHSNLLQLPGRPFCPNLDLYGLTLFFTWSAEGNIHKSLQLCFAQILTDYMHWTHLSVGIVLPVPFNIAYIRLDWGAFITWIHQIEAILMNILF